MALKFQSNKMNVVCVFMFQTSRFLIFQISYISNNKRCVGMMRSGF